VWLSSDSNRAYRTVLNILQSPRRCAAMRPLSVSLTNDIPNRFN
jgi:hypothetical protein